MILRVLILVLSLSNALAATVFVRDGAAGSGASWSDALDDLPATLVRGNTYYIADGTYAAYNFDDAESGTTLITVKKATASDHGTETGWLSSYGDGQAVFGAMIFYRDYIVIDGYHRNESNWLDPNGYGIRIQRVYSHTSNYPPGGDNITLRYCDIGNTYSQSTVSVQEAIYLLSDGGDTVESITVSYCFLHNSSFIQMAGVDGITIEYNAFAAGWAKEAIRGQGKAKNGVIRFNKFYNSTQKDPNDATSGTTAEIGIWDGGANNFDNWDIYGNVFWNDKSISHSGGVIVVGGDGVSWAGSPANNVKIYNNTIAGTQAGTAAILINGGTGNEIVNTLWYDSVGTPTATPNTNSNGEESSDPFVNYAGFNFNLSGALAGTSLASPYNTDLSGATRGADGTFDRGAFEYSSGGGGTSGGGGAGGGLLSGSVTLGASATIQ